jgi:phytanoyl-CoA hydroxylase
VSPAEASFNARAEKRALPAWTSWAPGRPPGYFDLPLGPEAPEFFRENGFLVVENALNESELEALRSETLAIAKGERGDVRGATELTGRETDEEVLAGVLCIHFPHKLSEVMLDAVKQPAAIEALTAVIGPNVKCMQSMLFVKASGKPGQAWHQDEIYIPTRDRSLTGAWFALDDATVENGCLWVLPGSNRPGILYYQEWHGDPRFDCAWEARRFPYSNDEAVPVEVKAGSMVVFNGYTLHRSLPNYALSGFRRALVNHYMSAESLLPWFGTCEGGPAGLDRRDIILVAGEDPYAWKGLEEIHSAHIRPDGKGGCGNFQYNVDPD